MPNKFGKSESLDKKTGFGGIVGACFNTNDPFNPQYGQLELVGFSREQAEIQVQVQVITEIIEDDLATKQDLQILDSGLRGEMQQLSGTLRGEMQQLSTTLQSEMQQRSATLRGEMQQLSATLHGEMQQLSTALHGEMQQLSATLRAEMQQLEYRLTIKLGTLLIIGFSTMATLMKFWAVH